MTDGAESLTDLEAMSRQVAEAVMEHDAVRLISHNDADGLAAAGIMCNALYRKGILFQATITGQFDPSTVELIKKTSPGAVILCDMGSGQAELASKVDEAIIIDHHKPSGELKHVQFNPHLIGIDGSSQLCASCSAYMIARQMGDNTDLSGLALVGAVGDKQEMTGSNRFILDEAVEKKAVTVEKGLRMGGGTVEELLEYSIDPYLDISGDKDRIREFIEETGIKGRLSELSKEQLIKLTSLIVLKLAKQGSLSAVDSIIGDVLILNNEIVSNIYDLVNILNACGSAEKAGLGISVCMRDASSLPEAVSTAREHQQTVIRTIKKAQANVKSAQNFRYVFLDGSKGSGAVAGTLIRYIYPDKPFIALNEIEDRIKVSARGTRKLVEAGLDLASAMREASALVGGMGGGHSVASGASIPKGTAAKFIEAVDSIIERQLKGNEA